MASVGIPGSPSELFNAANQFAATAQHLNDQRDQILNASNQATSNWQSQGAFAFTGASNWLQASVTNAGQGFEQAAVATRAYGTALQTAQDGWNKCNQELHQLQSDLQTAKAQLAQAEATNAQRANANMAAAVFTGFPSVSLGAAPPGPTPLPMIDATPIQDHISSLTLDIQRVQHQMKVFEADAEQAAHNYAGTLGSAQSKGGSGGIFGELINGPAQVVGGLVSAVSSASGQFGQGAAGFFSGVGNSLGNQLYGAYEAIIHGRYFQWRQEQQIQSAKQTDYAIHNPGAVAGALFDMNDFSHGRYFRWGGNLWALGLTTLAPVGGVAADSLRGEAAVNNAAIDMAKVGYAQQGFFYHDPMAGLRDPTEYGPIDFGYGRQLTSNVYSGMPHGVTVDVVTHPNGARTMTLFGPNDGYLYHTDNNYGPADGVDLINIHGSPYATSVQGSTAQMSLSGEQLASITKQQGLGNCPIVFTGCSTGQAPNGFGLQYSNALGGQTVVAPTDLASHIPEGIFVGHTDPLTGQFISAQHPWRVYGDGGSWVP